MNSSRRTKSGVYENISTNRSINQSETKTSTKSKKVLKERTSDLLNKISQSHFSNMSKASSGIYRMQFKSSQYSGGIFPNQSLKYPMLSKTKSKPKF